MGNKAKLQEHLQQLGLTPDESIIFINLLEGPKNQLEISRATGIARSNVYRIVDELIEKSLVHETTTDEGKLLETARPEALELLIIEQEALAKKQRNSLSDILGMMTGIRNVEENFAIRTYSGEAGLKQMLWNELSTKREICIFSAGSLDPATGRNWAEKYREEIIFRNITQRLLGNSGMAEIHSAHKNYIGKHCIVREVSPEILTITTEITIHDDTISIYNSRVYNVQLGTEIKNPLLADFMRQIFEHYWKLAESPKG